MSDKCPICSKSVFFKEEKRIEGRVYHKKCFHCKTCNKALESTSACVNNNLLYCKTCYAKQFGTLTCQSTTVKPPGADGSTGNKDDPDSCARCGKKVYHAEQVLALSRKWHKLCFKCTKCGKAVEPGSEKDHEGSLYCKACHSREHGPKGCGFGIGAGAMTSE